MAKKKNSRIVVEHVKEGVRVRIDHAHSEQHAIWMLAQAISRISILEMEEKLPTVEEDVDPLNSEEVSEDEAVQELSDADGEKEEADVPNVQ